MSTFLQHFLSFFSKRLRWQGRSKGFTLVELLVVIGIMTILTGIFLFQQRQFDSSTLLRSLAYSIALSIREAQTYGVSVRAVGSEFPAYGIYVNIANNDEYILFADRNDNGQYDAANNELVDNYVLRGSFSITDICAKQGSQDCTLNWLAITFRRPNPDACIASDVNAAVCGATNTSTYTEAHIQIAGPGGTTRSVTVTPSGQISVGGVGS